MAVLDPRLRLLREERGVGPHDLARTTHRGIEETQQVLEGLVEAGLAVRNGKDYRLSAAALRQLEQAGAGRGARAPSRGEREEAVLRHVGRRGRITRREAAELAGIGPYQASRLLDRLVAEGKLVRPGRSRAGESGRRHRHKRVGAHAGGAAGALALPPDDPDRGCSALPSGPLARRAAGGAPQAATS